MPIISNTIQNNTGGSSSSITPRSRMYRSGNSTIHLQEGQMLKGVVSDVHGNEITLSMEDGSSFTGKLPDANQYSIGQKAAFMVTSLENNTIYMKAVTSAYLLDMEDTIEQALEEAGLPKTPRNLEIVRSLLQNQQSISKENILSSLRLCAQYPDADVNSIITMKRLGMDITTESAKQFEQYQNQTHQLLYKMDSLTDSISDMMSSIGKQVPRLAKEVGTQILNMALEGNPSLEETTLMQNMAASPAGEVILDADGNPIPTEGMVTDTADELLPDNEINATPLVGEEALQETPEETTGPFSKLKQMISTFADNVSGAKETLVENTSTPFIKEQTGFLLSPTERQSFTEFLKEFPLPEEIKQSLANGTITAREFLTQIQQAFPQMTEEQASSLLASKPFHKIVKGQFFTGWTVSPERLKQEGALDEVYDKMSRQFESLSTFSEKVLGKDVFQQLSNTASDMNDNLNFMKTLNDTFQYLQLPLKLQNQNAHGDLYVMTRKESLKKNPNSLKVLLHLDMDHLGTLDIHIAKENTSVSTRFFVSNKDAKNLLERNINLLTDAINEQGYSFTSSLELKEKDVDIVKDFVGADAPPVGDLKRYNFDLRA